MKKGSTGTYTCYYKTDCVIGTGQFMATKNDHNNTKTKDGSWLVMEEEEMDIGKMLCDWSLANSLVEIESKRRVLSGFPG